jgi:DNA-binding NarL/FixJ family response regulator
VFVSILAMPEAPHNEYNIEEEEKSFLIIEDDTSFSRILRCRLLFYFPNSRLYSFSNLQGAREFLSSNPSNTFDLVLLDHQLPDGYGITFLKEGWFGELAVLVVSSFDNPEMAGASLEAGAAYFLSKTQVTSELFHPLIRGLIERNRIQVQLQQHRLKEARLDAIKDLVQKLRHEVNNPLGAVLGSAHLLKTYKLSPETHQEALDRVELSGYRIKAVIDELHAMMLEGKNEIDSRDMDARPEDKMLIDRATSNVYNATNGISSRPDLEVLTPKNNFRVIRSSDTEEVSKHMTLDKAKEFIQMIKT